MTEPEQNWRSKWDQECPLTIGVALQNWEQWSDAALRDELKRIRNTGFQTVRVTFNRDTDIERSPGMVNWRNPDRFFDAAEQVGLKIWCAPGNEPHHSISTDNNSSIKIVRAHADVTKWIQRFVRQFSGHPALLAWVMESGGYFRNPDHDDFRTEANFQQAHEEEEGLLRAFYETDPAHPVLIKNYSLSSPISNLKAYSLDAPHALAGIPGSLRTLMDGTRELDRPFYLTTKFGVDNEALHWPILFDCTGGSTGYGSDRAFSMTAGLMTRILLLALVSGIKSVWFDQWHGNIHSSSIGLLDWLDRVTPSTQAAGHIAQSIENYRQELWHGQSIPRAQILCIGIASVKLRYGVGRALLNANLPFGFITDAQFMDDSVPTVPILFLPGTTRISEAMLVKLKTLVENGTRLVTEVPSGFFDDNGQLLNTRSGSNFEQLFGVSIAGLFYADPPNPSESPTPAQLRAYIVTTTARAGGGSGEVPAFTENRVGKGCALLINLPLSQINADANLPNAQLSLLSYILGSRQTELPGLTGCLQFRRQGQNAEHVFLINDSAEERSVAIPLASPYTEARDVLADAVLNVVEASVNVAVPAGSGCWIRLS